MAWFWRVFASRACSALATVCVAATVPVPGAAQVTAGLVADYRFDEGSGASIADVSGNGHDGTAYGAFAWETGQLRVTGTSLSQFGHVSLSRGSMLDASWTVDLIFEAQNSGEHTAGRVWSASSGVGGTGPEVFFRSGNYLGFRINNPSTVWDPPAVGSRSSAAPPDHYVLPTTPISWGVPQHYVVTHDATAKRVRMYLATVAAPDLALVFDGTYTGSYAVGPSDIRLSHSHDDANPRYISGAFDRLRIYDRVLSADEAEQNHDGGTTTEFVVDPYPIDLSLGISRSGHYFSYGGRPKMMLMDSGTQCVMQNLDLDHRAWIDRTRDEGHAGVHIWAFVPPRQRLDGSVVEERWGYVYPGITPWPRKTEGANAADGGKQWDLMSFDEGSDPGRNYWPRLRDLCQRLRDQDRVLGITVFFGWPKDTADFPYHPFAAASGGPATSRGDITHIESPGTEIHQQAYSDSWPARRKVQWLWERFALKLIETSDSCGNIWFDFRDEWSYDNDTNMEEHFRNFFMSRGQLWADRSAAASFRVANPVVPAFGATPSMKTEGEPYEHGAVRVEVWTRALGGIHFLLHNDSRDPGIMAWDATTATMHGLDQATDRGRQYVGQAARFFNTELRSLDSMVPNDGLVSGSAHCLATPGLEYAIYIPAGQASVTVDLTPVAGDVQARFLDPRLGLFEAASVVAGGASRTFSTPASNFDWVLHLVATRDADSDGLADVDERANGTNPGAADTDGDGYGDADEVNLHGTNPRDQTSFPGANGDAGSDAGRDAGAGTDAGGDGGRDASVDAGTDADRSDDGGDAADIGGGNDRAGQVADSGVGDGTSGGDDRDAGSDAGNVPDPGCGGCAATSAAAGPRASAGSVLGAALLLLLGLVRWRRSGRP